MTEPNFSDVFEGPKDGDDTLNEPRSAAQKSGAKDGTAEKAEERDTEKEDHSSASERTEDPAREGGTKSPETEMDDLVRDAGMVNPYTNEAIRSKADFLAWKKRYQEDSAAAERKPPSSPSCAKRTTGPGYASRYSSQICFGVPRSWSANRGTVTSMPL